MRASYLLTFFCVLTSSLWAVALDLPDIWLGDQTEDPSNLWSEVNNWSKGALPANDGTATVQFNSINGDEDSPDTVQLDSSHDLFALIFGENAIYSFNSFLGSTNLTIRDRIQFSSSYESGAYFNYDVAIHTDGDTSFIIGSGSEIELAGELHQSSGDTLTVTGGGALLFSGSNSDSTLQGTLHIMNGFLGVATENALGTALIKLGDPSDPGEFTAGIIAVDGDQTIANDIKVYGHLQTEEDDYDDNELNLEGTVTLEADTQINNYGGLLNFMGTVTETTSGTKIYIDADEPVLFTGTSSFTGGIHMESGLALFGGLSAIPSTGLFTSASDNVYVGLMVGATDQLAATSAFLARFSPTGYEGTIGFDTDPESSTPNTYTGPIDLTGLTAERIGSVTIAEITGTITPSGSNYVFGGGAGTLMVGSLLTDGTGSRGLDAFSFFDEPATIYINNSSNSFTGDVSSTHSALIFGNAPGALPTGVTLNLGSGGYIGLQDGTRSIASYLGQFAVGTNLGTIGFDSTDHATQRTISDTIDLSGFTATSPHFAIGTATNVKITGNIVLPTNSNTYRFTAFKGGSFDVATTLSDDDGARSVVIGDNTSKGAHLAEQIEGDDIYSSVRLSNANTYSGGTTLESGQLLLGHSDALGTGTLTVDGPLGEEVLLLESGFGDFFDFELNPVLVADADNLIITNPLDLDSNVTVHSGFDSNDRNMTLNGLISGANFLVKSGPGTLNIGDNTNTHFGTYIYEGTLNFAGDNSAGPGPLGFGGGYGQTVNFQSMNPTIGGLFEIFDDYSGGYSSALVNIATGSTLTLDVTNNYMAFGGSIAGDGAVRVTGNGTQMLTGNSSFTGGLTIANGATVQTGEYGSIGSSSTGNPSLTLDGGNLVLGGDPHDMYSGLNADISFGSGGGEIRGNGVLNFSSPLSIGSGVSINPGNSVGTVNFNGPLQFGELGSINVEIGADNAGNIINDLVLANSLTITANSVNPFSINVDGENGQLPGGFNPLQAYSLAIIISSSTITNFDQLALNLSLSSLVQNAGNGFWNLSLGTMQDPVTSTTPTDNAIMLNFTPVPEPSTAALLILGFGFLGLRRSRSRQ